jgi:hypothetical protein
MEVPLQEDCLKPSFRIDIFISFQNILDSYLKRKQSENICNVRLCKACLYQREFRWSDGRTWR